MKWFNGFYKFKFTSNEDNKFMKKKRIKKYINKIWLCDINEPVLNNEFVAFDDEDKVIITEEKEIIKYTMSTTKQVIFDRKIVNTEFIFMNKIGYQDGKVIIEIEADNYFCQIPAEEYNLQNYGNLSDDYTNKIGFFVCVFKHKNKDISIKDLKKLDSEYYEENRQTITRFINDCDVEEDQSSEDSQEEENKQYIFDMEYSHTNNNDLDEIVLLFINSLNLETSSVYHTILSTITQTNVFTFFIIKSNIYVYVCNSFFNLILLHNAFKEINVNDLLDLCVLGEEIKIIKQGMNLLSKYTLLPTDITKYKKDIINNNDVIIECNDVNKSVHTFVKLINEIKPFIYTDLVMMPIIKKLEYLLHGPYYKIVSTYKTNSFYLSNNSSSSLSLSKLDSLSMSKPKAKKQVNILNEPFKIISRKITLEYKSFPLVFHCKSGVKKAYVNEQFKIKSNMVYDINSGKISLIQSEQTEMFEIPEIVIFILTFKGQLDFIRLFNDFAINNENTLNIVVITILIKRACMDKNINDLNYLLNKIKNIKFSDIELEMICKSINNYSMSNILSDTCNISIKHIDNISNIAVLLSILDHGYTNDKIIQRIKEIYEENDWITEENLNYKEIVDHNLTYYI
ncbi:hypothetical protein EHP00_1902 [Ecytonucleospora hepatopenaei]|uniref:Uncharacterized protein n=1 Tax=Ecytonucleospora hepatopenaei TaxID=646526 RepID=A0A1W0E3K9_9MICR|nr:hypothetical protein EHP00_1902 [Ecytonucleospora hepatopenaei]